MIRILTTSLFIGFICFSAVGQKKNTQTLANSLKDKLNYRCIGPFRGGRSAAVTGVEGKPMLFYMGTTGGGVWKTENGEVPGKIFLTDFLEVQLGRSMYLNRILISFMSEVVK